MSENEEESNAATLQTHTDMLQATKIELLDLVTEFTSLQFNLIERVSGVGRCGSCGKRGTLGSSAIPSYSPEHKLIMTCVDSDCGMTNYLTEVGEAWVNQLREPLGGLGEELETLVESVFSACDMEQALQLKSNKIAELEHDLTSLAAKITSLQDDIIKKSPQARSRLVECEKSSIGKGKENTPPSRKSLLKTPSKSPMKVPQVGATDGHAKPFRNPFKVQPKTLAQETRSRSRSRDRDRLVASDPDSEEEVRASQVQTKVQPKTLAQATRSRSRSRDRDRRVASDSDSEEEVRASRVQTKRANAVDGGKAGIEMEGTDRGRRRERSSPTPDKASKKLRQEADDDWIPSRADYEKLRKENADLKEGLLRLQLSMNHLTSLLERERMTGARAPTVGARKQKEKRSTEEGQRGPVRNDNKPSLETRRDIEEGSSARSSEGEAGKEARQNSGVDGNSAAGGRTAEREEKKKKSNRPKAQKGTTAAPPNEQETNTVKMSYAKAAAKVAKDPELKERQLRNQRERDKALLLFTAPVEETKATPKEWKVLYIKWNLTVKMRKEGPKELHHLALRMLEKVKVRKLVREISMIGKSTIALYYIADFHDRITEAFTRAKVTMVDHPETLPTDVGVRTAAVNRVAYLLRRHYYITKLRALLLSQLDTEELRQEAITKSRINHHD